MSKRKPNKTGKTMGGPPIINEARLRSTNSQIGNAAQIVGSPGAVVNQSHTTQVQGSLGLSRTDLIVAILLVFAVVTVASKATISLGLPPMVGQLVAGAALAGIVWKCFERVEAVLTEQTKFEIAVWLVARKQLGPKSSTVAFNSGEAIRSSIWISPFFLDVFSTFSGHLFCFACRYTMCRAS